MSEQDVWIFISYAHDDDLPTGDSEDEEGFVTYLHRKLETKLRELGASQAKLWRDHKRFGNGDPYDVEIEDALKKSALLIVVMSKNWINRPYCRKELSEFIRMRQAEGIANVEERMVVVGKRFVPKENRPAPLNLQMGFDFYEREDQDDVSPDKEYFNLGKPLDNTAYFKVRDDLAKHLQKRVERIAAGAGTGTTAPPGAKIAADNGRIIYLSKPAADMEQAYSRLALELQGRGYCVVPDVSSGIPSSGARAYIDAALNKAELSVHLVGEKRGFVPDDDDTQEPIVKLQLLQARGNSTPEDLDRNLARFRRIVWAPKVLELAEPAGANTVAERDPLKVLERFDAQVPSDKIDGDILSKFIEFLFQYLAQTAPRPVLKAPANGKLEVYLSYHGADEAFAGAVVEALRESPVKVQVPAAGSDAETRRYNDDLLMKCDAVTLCWANASEVWVRSEADKLKDWETLGRKQQFARRSLIAGPPPVPHKRAQFMRILFQDGQFDKVIDLVEKGAPTPELLADLAPQTPGPGP